MATRKYTNEQLQQELARPKRVGGRPRKYATEEERKRASTERSMRCYWRKRGLIDAINPDIALRKQPHATDEERKVARRAANMRSYYAHHAERTLHQAAYIANTRVV